MASRRRDRVPSTVERAGMLMPAASVSVANTTCAAQERLDLLRLPHSYTSQAALHVHIFMKMVTLRHEQLQLLNIRDNA